MIFPRSTDKKWRVSHNGDADADLVETRGLDFSNGQLVTNKDKATVLYTNVEDSNVGVLLAVAGNESVYYFVSSDGIYSTTDAITFSELTTSGRPSVNLSTDAVIFGGNLVVSGSTAVGYYDGSWHSGVTGLSSSYPHPLSVYETGNSTGATLAVGNGNIVTTYSTSYVLQSTLTIPIEYVVTWIRARSNNLYIGTRNVSGGTAKLFIWNGSSVGAQFYYGVQADWMYSGCEYDNGIAVITSAGQLLKFNGGGFDELENLPVYETPYSWSSGSSVSNGIGKAAGRGMIAKGKNLYLNIDGSVTLPNGQGWPGTYMVNQPSGVWEYNPTKGLSHLSGYPYTRYQTLTASGLATNGLVFTTAHGAATGDPVYCGVSTGLIGINNQQTYYAIVIGDFVTQLALTPADAAAGRPLSITGTVGSATFSFDVLDSLGTTAITAPGAIGLINTILPNAFHATTMFFGGSTNNASATNTFMFMGMGLGRSRGYFVTTQMVSQGILDTYNNLYASILYLTQVVDSLHLKYKVDQTIEYTTISSRITWTSATVFTATESPLVDFAGVAVGDEVMIVGGAGAGYAAHITSITQVGSIYTVTLAEAIPLVVNGNISNVIVDNWKELDPVISTNEHIPQGFSKVAINKEGNTMSIKVELRGRNTVLSKLIVSNSTKQPIT